MEKLWRLDSWENIFLKSGNGAPAENGKSAMKRRNYVLFIVPGALLIGIGTLLSMDYVTSEHRWQVLQVQRLKSGDRLDLKDFISPEIPDNDNFAKAPILRSFQAGCVTQRFSKLIIFPKEELGGNWQSGCRADLKMFAAYKQTNDLLSYLAPLETPLRELDEASLRPQCLASGKYSFDMMNLYIPCLALRLRALAFLDKGMGDLALKDILTTLRIADHLKAEPSLLSQLMRNSILDCAMQPAWEGLAAHKWDDSQLAIIQKHLLRVDILASTQRAFEFARIRYNTFLSCAAEGLPLPIFFQRPDHPEERPPHPGWLKRGWIYRNMLEEDQFHICLSEIMHPESHRVFPEKTVDSQNWLKSRRFRIDLTRTQTSVDRLLKQAEMAAYLQSMYDQAAIACALERYRIGKGTYPDSLYKLSPTFMKQMPLDIITGQPIRYRRKENIFLLYSLGWEQRDEGGLQTLPGEASESAFSIKGNWTWMANSR